jgi:hypothetical protein
VGCTVASRTHCKLFIWPSQDSREKQSRLLIHPMSALARRYPPLSSPRVHVVGVSPEPPERVGAYLQGLQRSIDFTALADKDGSLSSAYTRAHGNQRTPHAYLINGSGFVEWHGHPTQLEVTTSTDIYMVFSCLWHLTLLCPQIYLDTVGPLQVIGFG